MSGLDKSRLERLTRRIEDRLQRGESSRAIIQLLEEWEGARTRNDSSAEILRMAGVTASCTMGPHGLLSNWCAAAHRKIAESAS